MLCEAGVDMGRVWMVLFQCINVGLSEEETRSVSLTRLIGGLGIEGDEGDVIACVMGRKKLGVQIAHVLAVAPILLATQS